MKRLQKLISESRAKSAARFMMVACYFVMVFFLAGLILSFIGRQTFILHTNTGTYDRAMYAEEERGRVSSGPTVFLKDEVRVFAFDNGRIDLITQIGLSCMYAINIIPLMIGYWLLSRVFHNISEGRIFTSQNASYLLYYGLIRMAVAGLVPFAKLLISHLANQFTGSQISIATGQTLFNDLIPSVAFIVAAYIIHYGIHLQDEADHTL